MESEFINLTAENICEEHLCCIIRSKKSHPGVEAKRSWLSGQLKEGHVFRKLNEKGCCFIEYAHLEKAWVPITGDNFYYIYCLWVDGKLKGKGYGRELMEYCIADAREKGKSGTSCYKGRIPWRECRRTYSARPSGQEATRGTLQERSREVRPRGTSLRCRRKGQAYTLLLQALEGCQ